MSYELAWLLTLNPPIPGERVSTKDSYQDSPSSLLQNRQIPVTMKKEEEVEEKLQMTVASNKVKPMKLAVLECHAFSILVTTYQPPEL